MELPEVKLCDQQLLGQRDLSTAAGKCGAERTFWGDLLRVTGVTMQESGVHVKHCCHGGSLSAGMPGACCLQDQKKSLSDSCNSLGMDIKLYSFPAFFFSWCLLWKTHSQKLCSKKRN